MIIRVNEVGKVILVGVNYNVANNTNLKLKFKSPCGDNDFEVESPLVTAPSSDSEDLYDTGVLPGNTYLSYSTREGDLPEPGEWKVIAVYEDDTPKKYIGSPALFQVQESC